MTPLPPAPPELHESLRRWQRVAILVGCAGILVCVVGVFFEPHQLLRSWLIGWLLWLGIALGSLGLEMLQYLTGGQWALIARRLFESAARTLPILLLLFVPVIIGMPFLYPWVGAAPADELLRHKAPYLNVPFFIIRVAIYFALWIGGAYLLHRWAESQDDPVTFKRTRALSAIGIIVYSFSITFAAIDWAESLEPHFYSTIWGFLFIAGQGLTTMCFIICLVAFLSRWPPFSQVVRTKHIHDYGKLLLMFVMLWAYMSFSQFLIVWAGDLPHEITWYFEPMSTSWGWLGSAVILFHFLIPFLALLSRPLKTNSRTLVIIASVIFFMRLVDMFWLVTPSVHEQGAYMTWTDVVAPVTVGAVWMAAFLWQLRRRPLLDTEDPRFAEVVAGG